MRTLSLGLFIMLSCASLPPNSVIISKDDKIYLDKARSQDKARADLIQSPDRFVSSDHWEKTDSGTLNTYTKASYVRFINKSEFDVTDIQGRIYYTDQAGREMAIVPFIASGEVAAGQQAKLKVDSNEITGKATGARVVVEKVRARR